MSGDDLGPAGGETLNFLEVVRRSGVLADRALRKVRVRVEGGVYPKAPIALAERLVRDEVLTRYQADRLLRNKTSGLVIDRYVILERLGEGAMARVYKAYHRLMGRVVAIKVIAPRYASRARSIARFQREMRMIGRLDHPHIIRAYDADRVDSAFFLVMEYAGGQSLDRVLVARGPLPHREVVDYAAQAALGLAHAHVHGVVHRDIKPSNLLLTDERQIKILDLGLGTLVDASEQTSFATLAGHAVGTIDFMSPEQASGGDVDGRSDCFGLGCTMYFLMTGQHPFPGNNSMERLVRRLKGPPVPITEHRPDLPPDVIRVLQKLLARRPEDRFQTAAEAAEGLLALLRGDRSGAPHVPPAPTPPGPPLPSPDHAAPPEAPSGSFDRPPPSAPPDGALSDRGRGPVHSLLSLAEHSPRMVLATLLGGLLAAFAAGFILGRW